MRPETLLLAVLSALPHAARADACLGRVALGGEDPDFVDALAELVEDAEVRVVDADDDCAALAVRVSQEGEGVRLEEVAGSSRWMPSLEATAALIEARALAHLPTRGAVESPTHALRAVGLRAEVDVAGVEGVGQGLVAELRQPLGRWFAVLLRGRGARGVFDRVELRELPEAIDWLEASATLGAAFRLPLAERLSLEAALAGGVRFTELDREVDGCPIGATCTLSDHLPAVSDWSQVAPLGEGTLGLLLLVGGDWGFDLSCTVAVSDGDGGPGQRTDERAVSLRGGLGVRVGLE